MFSDILAVFVLSLFLCTPSVHGLPPSSSFNRQLIQPSSSADLRSTLRLFNSPRPVLSVDHDSDGEISDMFTGESNEDDDDSFFSSLERSKSDFQPSSNLLFRKLLQQQQQQQQQQKRASTPPQYNLHSAAAVLADSSKAKSATNFNQLEEPIRLSPSLKTLIETNPFARAWLTMLLQKLMQEQHVPYIFKYGRRRK